MKNKLTFSLLLATQIAFSQLKVTPSGNVGIGIDPVGQLHMTGDFRAKGHFWLFPYNGQGAGGTAFIQARDGSNTQIGLTVRVQDNLVIRNAIYISPQSNIYLNYDNVGYTYMRGTLLQTSDATLKENINTIQSATEKLNRLRGVSYNFKTKSALSKTSRISSTDTIPQGYSGKEATDTHLGLLAQEVEKVFPDLVKVSENGYKAVAYIELIPVLIEALKEQNAKIETLESKQTKAAIRVDAGVSSVAGAYLFQNIPNPFNQDTQIKYAVSESAGTAFITITDLNGKQLKYLPITAKGENSVTIKANELYAGLFIYTLVVDGAIVASKQMVVVQ